MRARMSYSKLAPQSCWNCMQVLNPLQSRWLMVLIHMTRSMHVCSP